MSGGKWTQQEERSVMKRVMKRRECQPGEGEEEEEDKKEEEGDSNPV